MHAAALPDADASRVDMPTTSHRSGPESIKLMLPRAFAALKPHEQQHGHPAQVLQQLLLHAPLDAQIWDVLGLTLKASRAASVPPAVGGLPGKQLLSALYAVFCDERGPIALDSSADKDIDKKERLGQWKVRATSQ